MGFAVRKQELLQVCTSVMITFTFRWINMKTIPEEPVCLCTVTMKE